MTEPSPEEPLVDYVVTARRVRRSAVRVGIAVLVAWVATAVASTAWRLDVLATLVFIGLGVMFLVELVVVGGSAVRGMLRAGDRGERLASDDVAIVPPQLRRRRREESS